MAFSGEGARLPPAAAADRSPHLLPSPRLQFGVPRYGATLSGIVAYAGDVVGGEEGSRGLGELRLGAHVAGDGCMERCS